jgi:hypothetical protein
VERRRRDHGGHRFSGCEDIDFTPAAPFTVRLTTTVSLD